MPHGSLTPLGHRLRSVLLALRPNPFHLDTASSSSAPKTLIYPALHATITTAASPSDSQKPSFEAGSDPFPPRRHDSQDEEASPTHNALTRLLKHHVPSPPSQRNSRRRENKRTKVDWLGKELEAIGKSDAAPQRPPPGKRENHFNHRSNHAKRLHTENKKRLASKGTPLLRPTIPYVNPVIADHIARIASQSDDVQAGCMTGTAFDLPQNVNKYLASIGLDKTDVEALVVVLTELDSYKAASMLQARVASHGARSVPFSVMSYSLRRPYITADALRIFMEQLWNFLADTSNPAVQKLSPDAIFVTFVRLTRHARRVWPAALPSIADYLIRFLPKARPNRDGDYGSALQTTTFMLNKAMYLISEPTSVTPFKDIKHQEAAVIKLLSAVAEHNPPLQINREGYRAVIRLQLASEKTDSERQWALLKALSWPPWKEDRTSMDSEIGPEHGISRARATLLRMKEAGYAPQAWEKTAGVYTGWDIDGTPTIQTRVILSVEDISSVGGHTAEGQHPSLWVARIKTTRTVQEAWACYLAYEDCKYPADQSVLLAILEKLHEEEKRQRMLAAKEQESRQTRDRPLRKLLPGDRKEVEPLPPSTHLYTYTKTSPPSTHEFYGQLREHDIAVQGSCLTYLISNAASHKDGVEYLDTALACYPTISDLLASHPAAKLGGLPYALVDAYIKFLARFSNVNTTRASRKHALPGPESASLTLANIRFNPEHNLVKAIWVLQEHKPSFLPTWNAVLNALAHDESYRTIHLAAIPGTTRNITTALPNIDLNAILAYRLTLLVLQLLQRKNMVPDSYGFLALCRSTENVAISCWRILVEDHSSNSTEARTSLANAKTIVTSPTIQAQELLATQRPHERMEEYFKLLVGRSSFSMLDNATQHHSDNNNDKFTTLSLPRLLNVPDPALLHAYIRALGWHGSHTQILLTLKWMAKHQTELAESRDRARNGPKLMRRALVAVRVFLERSWLTTGRWESVQDYDSADAFTLAGLGRNVQQKQKSEILQKLETGASEELLQEARLLVEEELLGWGGWPTDEEIEAYCQGGRFAEIR